VRLDWPARAKLTAQYSAKLFNTLYHTVLPLLRARTGPPTLLILRPQVQPWHPSSTLVHEAALAVARLAPAAYWPYAAQLYAHQRDFFDVRVVREARNDTYRRLASLAPAVGVDADALYALLEVPHEPGPEGELNVGNAVTDDLKLLIRQARLLSIHVSPTVLFDGLVNNDIASSWGEKEWVAWADKNLV
jgi:hypothetical protein